MDFCDRNNPSSAVKSQRSDYWIPNSDGSFFGERTLTIDRAGGTRHPSGADIPDPRRPAARSPALSGAAGRTDHYGR
jgi:hypothetical protein